MEASLKKNQDSRSDAKTAMAEATALREKEAGQYGSLKEDSDTNIAALGKAISAVEGGMGGSFLQTKAASVVRNFIIDKAELADTTRQEVLSFLAGTESEGYAPAGGEILGILKQMSDDMSGALSSATADEKAALASFDSLMATKKKEEEALSAQIEEQMLRVGELGVKLAEMEHDLKDTKEGLAEDTKFLATLETDCKTKAAEWEEVQKTRQEELVALADTIKILNDDDALELFKKTLPGAGSASFMQVQVSSASTRARALAVIRGIPRGHKLSARPQLDLIALAIQGKKVGFEKVIKLIDDMMVSLKKEQQDDDDKKEYCEEQFDITEDKKKGLDVAIADSETAIDDLEGSIATLKEEIDALEDGIRALDKSVAEATKNRKAENAEYTETMANNGAAKEILLYAKNRLNKFYNPKLYKEDYPKPGSSEAMLLAQLQGKAPLGPPPAAPGPHKKQESSGVIGMIDLLVKDLDKDMQESKIMEKDAQQDYEALMKESGEKRAEDSKAVTDKSASLAAAEDGLEEEQDKKAGSEEALKATKFYLQSLHNECDWLIKYYDMRKSARTTEIEALESAKGVLSGADFSLVQTGRSSHRKGFLGY